MTIVKRVLGWMWASPVTLVGLAYAGLFGLLSWYKFLGRYDDSLVWLVDETAAPGWLLGLWRGWAGHAVGNIVVVRRHPTSERGAVLLRHEQEHCAQCMRLGVFQPIMYGLVMLTIKLGCKNLKSYHDCVFERDARVAAGQEPK